MTFLFIHSYPPFHILLSLVILYCRRSQTSWEWEGWTHSSKIHTKNTHYQTHSFQSTSTPPPPPIFHRSFSIDIHKSAKCPFQVAHKHPHRSPKMPPHSELLVVVSPQQFSSLQSRSDECHNECVHYSLPGKANGFWVEVSN